MSKTKQHFLEMQEHLQNTMDDDDYQHWEYVNRHSNLFFALKEAVNHAKKLELYIIKMK